MNNEANVTGDFYLDLQVIILLKLFFHIYLKLLLKKTRKMQATSAKQLVKRIQKHEVSLDITEKTIILTAGRSSGGAEQKSFAFLEDPFKLPAK